MIKVRVAAERPGDVRADGIALLLFEDRELFMKQRTELASVFRVPGRPFETGTFTGKAGQSLVLHTTDRRPRTLLVVGAGPTSKITRESVRRAAATAAKLAEAQRVRTLAFVSIPSHAILRSPAGAWDHPWRTYGFAITEGALLSLYRFDKYLSPSPDRPRTIRSVILLSGSPADRAELSRGAAAAVIVSEGTSLARDLANAPANEIYPETLAMRARAFGAAHGVAVNILNREKIADLRMGGLLGVSAGSHRPPRFIIMDYNRAASRRGTVVLVGKGVTFDSGGISIKPSAGMAEMKMDMSGGGAVIATVGTAARLRIPLHIVGLVPATENLPGGSALKPGDVLRHINGLTSEVDNTDAEGRLILADALAYAARYKPDLVIDLATLTGACVVALGHVATGMMGTAPRAMDVLRAAGERTYERVWPLPLYEEYEGLIKSEIADVKNVGGRWAGAITAAMFLKRFAGTTPWVHLDIAGTATMEEPSDYVPKGASGVGVRLLIDFLQQWKRG
jgi:leucyl aminopeptidase